MISVEAQSTADPATAWALLARPDRWRTWAAHVRGAIGLGSPEVAEGSRGAVLLAGVLPIPARITAKDEGRSWAWRVGPVLMDHRVRPTEAGCEVEVAVSAPGPLEALVRAAYAPIVERLLDNLAREAERVAGSRETRP